nr:thioredoxin family protein [uncultured Methanospirillum sp.]
MKIEILGSGYAKCSCLYDNTVEAVKKAGVQAEIVKVDDLGEIVGRGVLMTPSLFIDGKERVSGRVPTVNEIIGILGGA